MRLSELTDYIGTLLEVARYKDYCPNGLQVEGRGEVYKIATAVTASQQVIERAIEWGADAIVVHHGYFWRNEEAVIAGIKKRRIAALLQHDISLLAYHLPLDAHAELGNNAQLAQRLGWVEEGRFGEQNIACLGRGARSMSLKEIEISVGQVLRRTPMVIGDMQKGVRRIAWCSGGGQAYFAQAMELGVDAFLTGEISEQNVHMAQESGVAFIAAGHFATERFGVQALGAHLNGQCGLETRFFDQDVVV